MITLWISKEIFVPMLPGYGDEPQSSIIKFKKWSFDTAKFVEKIKFNWRNIFSAQVWVDNIKVETYLKPYKPGK